MPDVSNLAPLGIVKDAAMRWDAMMGFASRSVTEGEKVKIL